MDGIENQQPHLGGEEYLPIHPLRGVTPLTPQYEEVPVVEASEANVGVLVGMGFKREDAIRELKDSDNNVEVAANRLLQG